jgi:hypothetical protein
MINPTKQFTSDDMSTTPGTSNQKPMGSTNQSNHSLLGSTVKEAIQKYIELNPSLRKINTSELSKMVGVTRQRVSQILDELGEIRHKRTEQAVKTCPICDVEITRHANACRKHSHKKDDRVEGYKYRCKTCNKFKDLTEFTRSKRSPSGYEHRCLTCRADWQREYNKTLGGREKHKKIVKAHIDKHPERRRAYYKVFRALKDGILIKQPCENCFAEKTQAVHTDYSQPLNVRWLCRLCAARGDAISNSYVPNTFEDSYRKFINSNQNSNNISGKWIEAIQKYYGKNTLSKKILTNSLQQVENIPGLGAQYSTLTTQFLNQNTQKTG